MLDRMVVPATVIERPGEDVRALADGTPHRTGEDPERLRPASGL